MPVGRAELARAGTSMRTVRVTGVAGGLAPLSAGVAGTGVSDGVTGTTASGGGPPAE